MSTTLPWRDWYHGIVTTYGTWLRGDPRGWRTRHHREHVDGDYKHPVPGRHEWLYGRSQRLMKRSAVHLPLGLRAPILTEFATRLQQEGLLVVIASLDDHHLHTLTRFPDRNPRHWLGLAKKHTSLWCRDNRLPLKGGLWGARSQARPIQDRQHQLSVYGYILDHQQHGAAIWTYRAKPGINLTLD